MGLNGKSVIVGLVIPFLALVVVLPFLSDTSVTVLGIPLLFFWVFLWMPLTSFCLWIAWLVFDRQAYVGNGEER
jgi:hypothetical protein